MRHSLVVAMAWAAARDARPDQGSPPAIMASLASEIEKLADLKAKGVLTEQEFAQAKAAVIDDVDAPAGATAAPPVRAVFLHNWGMTHMFHFVEGLVCLNADLAAARRTHEDVALLYTSNKDAADPNKAPLNAYLTRRLFPRATLAFALPNHTWPAADDPRYATLTYDRRHLGHGAVNKMFLKFVAGFDDWMWSEALETTRNASVALPWPLPPLPWPPGSREAQDRTKGHRAWTRRYVAVTYIDRQNTARRLSDKAHSALLTTLAAMPGIQLRHVRMELLSLEAQFELAHQTDVLVGVHGNGLTHQLWMHPRRWVVEIFPAPETHQYDYYYLARLMGHAHLCVFDGRAQVQARWGLHRVDENNASAWRGDTVSVPGMSSPKSTTADLDPSALVAIQQHVSDAMENLLDPVSTPSGRGWGGYFPKELLPVQRKLE